MLDLPQAHTAGFASFISACQPLFPSDTWVDTSWPTNMWFSRMCDWRLRHNKQL